MGHRCDRSGCRNWQAHSRDGGVTDLLRGSAHGRFMHVTDLKTGRSIAHLCSMECVAAWVANRAEEEK